MTYPNGVEQRMYAGVFDEPISESEARGCSPSKEAIGGYYGISWCSFFRDAETGKVYSVYCSDGVNGGKSEYSPEDEVWRHDCFRAIVARHHNEAKADAKAIRISPKELCVMRGYMHDRWLESSKDAFDGKQVGRDTKEGLIGHCHGVPVIVDPKKVDELLPR